MNILTDIFFLFIAGLHRSGTSLFHQILRDHPQISGFSNAGAPQDEGQHLQSVFKPAKRYGGPGWYGFFPGSHLTENSSMATDENAEKLYSQWGKYWNMERDIYVEKSPFNIVIPRLLQKLFPNSYFITVYRHPIAVTMATLKTRFPQLRVPLVIKHWLKCYQKFEEDNIHLKNVMTFKYEDLIDDPPKILSKVYRFIGV